MVVPERVELSPYSFRSFLFYGVCALVRYVDTTGYVDIYNNVSNSNGNDFAIDDIEVSTGSRDDGTAYSVFNFFRKLGQVLSAVCVNGALLGMHYRYEKGAVQTLANLRKMYDLATLIPALLFALMALILFVFYPLSREKVAQLQLDKEDRLREACENNSIEI